MLRRALVVAVGVWCALWLAACGGGGDDDDKAAVSAADLAIMVVPKEELGPEFTPLQIHSGDSGKEDNAAAAENTLDPNDTGPELAEAGRIAGYHLTYSDPELAALDTQSGLVNVATSVELFRDAAAASAFMEDQFAAYERYRGKDVDAVTLVDATIYGIPELGDEARGLVAQLTAGGVAFWGTIVAFRKDELVAAVIITRADDENVRDEAERVAGTLERRIEGVLDGTLTDKPVAIPDKGGQESGEPEADLAALALSPDDLPEGTRITDEGYVENENTIATYRRDFDLPEAKLGGSEVLGLRSDVDLFETTGEAALAMRLTATASGRRSFASSFAKGFSASAGFEAKNVRVSRVRVETEGASALLATFDTREGRFETVFLFVRVDRVVSTTYAFGLASEFDPADLTPLADAVLERMEAGLGET